MGKTCSFIKNVSKNRARLGRVENICTVPCQITIPYLYFEQKWQPPAVSLCWLTLCMVASFLTVFAVAGLTSSRRAIIPQSPCGTHVRASQARCCIPDRVDPQRFPSPLRFARHSQLGNHCFAFSGFQKHLRNTRQAAYRQRIVISACKTRSASKVSTVMSCTESS
jgi:hypothetical protein